MPDPQFKIEYDDIDISEYVIVDGNFNTTTSDSIATGSFFVDISYPGTIEKFKQVKFYLKVDSYVHLFTGLITGLIEEKDKFRYKVTVSNNSWRYIKKTATNKFRQDSGTGNSMYIVKAINDEYTPSISYTTGTTGTIPNSDYEFTEQSYQNKYINEIYDFIAEITDRSWWVDKDILLNMKTRVFSSVSTTVTENNVKGSFTVDTDSSKMANVVIVDGARITTNITQTITGTGTTQEFDLDYVPNGTTKVVSGSTNYSVSIEGAEGFETDFDCYFKIGDRKLKFNSITLLSGTTADITYDVVSMVHDEQQDGASISDNEDIIIDKVITDENVTNQLDAFNLANNYLDNYSYPLQLITGRLFLTSQSQLEDWQIGNKVSINYTDANGSTIIGDYNLVQVEYKFGSSGVFLNVRFTDFPEQGKDLLKRLILKVKQREEKDRASRLNIVKYFYWGGSIYLEVENVSGRSDNRMDGETLIWDHPTQGQWDNFKWGTGTRSGTTTEEFVINSQSYFRDDFLKDRWYEDTGSTTATYNQGNTRYEFDNGEIYQSKYIEKNTNTYSKAKYTIDADDDTNWTIFTRTGTTGAFEEIEDTFTNITSGTDFRYKARYDGSGTTQALNEVKIDFSN